MPSIKSPKKLIEVALPLDAINVAAAREKSIRHGHPSTLHLWWARRPLAAARAVIFAQMVNDPAEVVPGDRRTRAWKNAVTQERERLFKIIEDLVKWENTNNEEVLERARTEIRRSWREVCALNKSHPQAVELFNSDKLPAFHDPFAGGGALPLEAQRLGLEAYASDLNPVAVTINKAMIEIPPRFAGCPPVSRGEDWSAGASPAKMSRGEALSAGVSPASLFRRQRPRRRCPLLRCMDASRSRKTHWPSIPKNRDHRRDGSRTPRPDTAYRAIAYHHRVVMGAHGKKPQSGVQSCRCAVGIYFCVVEQSGKRSLCATCC